MSAIRIRRTLDSETLCLPELRPLLGKDVEIIVLVEDKLPERPPDKELWDAALKAAESLRASGYDFDAWKKQREFDRKRAEAEL
jgi:hypothetical protein